MLYCKACQNRVPAGEARCYVCQNGFVNQLACASCHADVPRGATGCARCDGQHVIVESPVAEHFPGRGQVHHPVPPQHARALVPQLPQTGISITITHPGASLPAPPPPPISSLPRGVLAPIRVPESYMQHGHGAQAEVVMAGEDAAILNEMGNLAALLQVMAGRMNDLQGHMSSTRALIKACRNLSADIQEEIEVRIGPQGPLRAG